MRLVISIVAAFALGCDDRSLPTPASLGARPSTSLPNSQPTTQQSRNDLTLNDFRKLQADMTLEQVYGQVGQPARDIGSGIYILQYVLSDGSLIFVGSTGKNLLYVRHGSLHSGDEILGEGR